MQSQKLEDMMLALLDEKGDQQAEGTEALHSGLSFESDVAKSDSQLCTVGHHRLHELPDVTDHQSPMTVENHVGISSDVIEHIREPNGLLKFMRKLNCQYYVISTPKRELMIRSPSFIS